MGVVLYFKMWKLISLFIKYSVENDYAYLEVFIYANMYYTYTVNN